MFYSNCRAKCGSATLLYGSSSHKRMKWIFEVRAVCVFCIKECGSTTQRLSCFTVLTAKAGGG